MPPEKCGFSATSETLRCPPARDSTTAGSRESPQCAHFATHALRLSHRRRLHRSSARWQSARRTSRRARSHRRADAGNHARVQLFGNGFRVSAARSGTHPERAHLHPGIGAPVRRTSHRRLRIRARVDGRHPAQWRRDAHCPRGGRGSGAGPHPLVRREADILTADIREAARDQGSAAAAGNSVRGAFAGTKSHRRRRHDRARSGVVRRSLPVHPAEKTRRCCRG